MEQRHGAVTLFLIWPAMMLAMVEAAAAAASASKSTSVAAEEVATRSGRADSQSPVAQQQCENYALAGGSHHVAKFSSSRGGTFVVLDSDGS
jgi:hypothetical protein